ncbi:cellulose synthase operon protein YhjU [Litorivivens lipolytica]|uniref:Cellulose synthase operon protein YhjU n=1 Tax=Litorivivens lipolytica TaxID=1524264 RepID=A0A7W4W3W0_9GAMM|nr:cellulose biosynthesis protein BcsG [Litorivivens lipolytica]MBB3046972.1 cellulose synthase operon protein YhjU [Litorivivens lipolytica]
MEFKHVKALGWWNVYFAAKIALYFQDLAGFILIANLALALFLLIKTQYAGAAKAQQLVGVVVAIGLMYFENLLPPFFLPAEQGGGFMTWLGTLAWPMLLTTGLIALAYQYFLRFIEPGVVVAFLAVCVLVDKTNILNMLGADDASVQQVAASNGTEQRAIELTSDQALNASLAEFFDMESQRREPIQSIADDADFDILVLSVCSLGWDDLNMIGLSNHPLFEQFDIVFDRFNAATSYSGPAVIRLLNASCGQKPHSELFSDRYPKCQLATQLAQFEPVLMMNHDGAFDNFLSFINDQSGFDAELEPHTDIRIAQKSFDGTPIFDDLEILMRWHQQRSQRDRNEFAFYNTVSLHDGNRIIGQKAVGNESYRLRASAFLDQLSQFIKTLENSEQNTLLLIVPEHGAGLRGDRMQLPGMREIPAHSITHVPVAARLIGAKRRGPVARVTAQTSHLALSVLINNVIQQQPFQAESYTPASLVSNLPRTRRVSQNEGSTVMEVDGTDYVTLDERTWSAYPAN